MFTQNSNGGVLRVIVQEGGELVPLTGAAINITIVANGDGARTEMPVTSIDPVTSTCDIVLTSAILTAPGKYAYQLELNFPDGQRDYTTIDFFTVKAKL